MSGGTGAGWGGRGPPALLLFPLGLEFARFTLTRLFEISVRRPRRALCPLTIETLTQPLGNKKPFCRRMEDDCRVVKVAETSGKI